MDFYVDNINYSESDSEESEEEIITTIRRKPYTLRSRPNFLELFDSEDFLKRFRLEKQTVNIILNFIEDKIKSKTNRNHAISPLNQLLLTLRFYATGTFQIVIGDFGGLHKSTICKIIKKVSIALASLRSKYVCFPNIEERIKETNESFYRIARFPRVIGAIDCTHVKIQSPGGDEAEVFRNRKGIFSLNVQAVCNAELKFLDIVARWPGSTHDSTIFNASVLHAKFHAGNFRNNFLLGDSGYACSKYLLTPLLTTNSRAEELYNESHIRTRNVIERAFGVWKRRFPVLSLGLRLNLSTTQAVIVATSVLHNIARQMGDRDPPLDLEIRFYDENEHDWSLNLPTDIENENCERATLIDTYFARLAE